MAPTSMNRAGIGRSSQRAADRDHPVLQRLAQHLQHVLAELRQFVQEQHAVVGQADLARAGDAPPPISPASEMVWCGAAEGRVVTSDCCSPAAARRRCGSWWSRAPPRGSCRGRMDGSRRASMVLPAPGGPIIRTLCPPAAATSSARLACSWPLTSAKSTGVARVALEQLPRVDPGGRDLRGSRERNSAASASESTPITSSPSTTAASAAFSRGTISRSDAPARAQLAPSAARPDRRAGRRPGPARPAARIGQPVPASWSLAARMPSAMGRSNADPPCEVGGGQVDGDPPEGELNPGSPARR